MPGPAVEATTERAHESSLRLLLEGRVAKLPPLLAAALGDDPTEAVHDVRVWTRRVQQLLAAMWPDARPKPVRRLRRRLRRLRRRLGPWRNLDVVIEEVERRVRASRGKEARRGWSMVATALAERRAKEMSAARRRLLGADAGDLVAGLLESAREAPARDPREALRVRLERALQRFRAALAVAETDGGVEAAHALRIAAKGLRYTLELSRDLGIAELKPALEWLKRLQEALGDWHDRQVFRLIVAGVLGEPRVLLSEFAAVRAVVRQLERQSGAENESLARALALARTDPASMALDQWLEAAPEAARLVGV